jgi:hypothetical protein
MPNENIIDNNLKGNEEYWLDMVYYKALDDPPYMKILPMTWADKIIVANNNVLCDDDSILDEDINMPASYDNSHDSWVHNALGENDSSSSIAPKLDSLYPSCETMVTTICEDAN